MVEVVSRGGNFLLNVGPRPDGTIQPEFLEWLAAVGRWMKVNGAAIYGASYGPIQNEKPFRTTSKGNAIYIHLMEAPSAPLSLPAVVATDVRLLATNGPVPFSVKEGGLTIDARGIRPDPVAVLKVTTA